MRRCCEYPDVFFLLDSFYRAGPLHDLVQVLMRRSCEDMTDILYCKRPLHDLAQVLIRRSCGGYPDKFVSKRPLA